MLQLLFITELFKSKGFDVEKNELKIRPSREERFNYYDNGDIR